MKTWNLLLRRTHLYLGLLLLPWTLMYAASTWLFNHRLASGHGRPGDQAWKLLWEKPCDLPVPDGTDRLREFARQLLDSHKLTGTFGVQRQGSRLNIHLPNFRHPRRVTYDLDRKLLRAEQRDNSPLEILARLHVRAGYGQPGLLPNLWGFFVDLFCVATLAWIATGLYLWWKLPILRGWGFATMAAGATTILILIGTL